MVTRHTLVKLAAILINGRKVVYVDRQPLKSRIIFAWKCLKGDALAVECTSPRQSERWKAKRRLILAVTSILLFMAIYLLASYDMVPVMEPGRIRGIYYAFIITFGFVAQFVVILLAIDIKKR